MENLKQKIRNYTGAGLIGLAGLVGGCNEELADSLARTAWHQTTVSAIDSTIRNEIEGPRSSPVIVNNPPAPSQISQTSSYQTSSNTPTPQIYSTEIWNLDRNEKEDIEIYGGPEFMNTKISDYLLSRAKDENCSKRGYKIIQNFNGAPIKIGVIDKIYSVEIWNLDRNEKEDIEIYGGGDSVNKDIHIGQTDIIDKEFMGDKAGVYLYLKFTKEGTFSKNGYRVIKNLNGTPIRSEIITPKIEETIRYDTQEMKTLNTILGKRKDFIFSDYKITSFHLINEKGEKMFSRNFDYELLRKKTKTYWGWQDWKYSIVKRDN